MKAIYQKPATEIVVLSTSTHLLEGSNKNGILGDDPTQANFNLNETVNETGETSGNLSRRSIWDDED